MLEALAKDALINTQGLLPSSLAEQPSSSQAQGGGMTSLRPPMARVAGLGTGLLSSVGGWQEAGLLLRERERGHGCRRASQRARCRVLLLRGGHRLPQC